MGCGASTDGRPVLPASASGNETAGLPQPAPAPQRQHEGNAVVDYCAAEQSAAATKIAAAHRGKQDRARVDGIREAKRTEEAEQSTAATKIAAAHRGKQDRARVAKMNEDANSRLVTATSDVKQDDVEPGPIHCPADSQYGPLPPPPLPAGYSGRPQVISALLQKLINCKEGAIAVRGQGGLGKTTIASALVRQHLDELSARFPD